MSQDQGLFSQCSTIVELGSNPDLDTQGDLERPAAQLQHPASVSSASCPSECAMRVPSASLSTASLGDGSDSDDSTDSDGDDSTDSEIKISYNFRPVALKEPRYLNAASVAVDEDAESQDADVDIVGRDSDDDESESSDGSRESTAGSTQEEQLLAGHSQLDPVFSQSQLDNDQVDTMVVTYDTSTGTNDSRPQEFQRDTDKEDFMLLDKDEVFVQSTTNDDGDTVYARFHADIVHVPGLVEYGVLQKAYFTRVDQNGDLRPRRCLCGERIYKNGRAAGYEFSIAGSEKAHSTSGPLYWYDAICHGCAKYRYPRMMKRMAEARRRRRAGRARTAARNPDSARRELARRVRMGRASASG